jgi:hypothetical protein
MSPENSCALSGKDFCLATFADNVYLKTMEYMQNNT